MKTKTGRGLAIVDIAGPIGIDKTVQDGPTRGASLEDELLVAGGSEVSEHTVKSALVIITRVRGMASQGGNGVCEVQVRTQQWASMGYMSVPIALW
jgi:hypothetical protein